MSRNRTILLAVVFALALALAGCSSPDEGGDGTAVDDDVLQDTTATDNDAGAEPQQPNGTANTETTADGAAETGTTAAGENETESGDTDETETTEAAIDEAEPGTFKAALDEAAIPRSWVDQLSVAWTPT